jgi:hypothetical protein
LDRELFSAGYAFDTRSSSILGLIFRRSSYLWRRLP